MRRIASVIILAGSLAACTTAGTTPSPTPPTIPPPTLAQDSADCGIQLALAYLTGGSSGLAGAISSTASCQRLPGDVLAKIEGSATTRATAARRTMRLR
jgi:hypothetical protein